MQFRRVGIVMASLALASTGVYGEGEAELYAEPVVSEDGYTFHPPLGFYDATAINRARLVATAVAVPERHERFAEVRFISLEDTRRLFLEAEEGLVTDTLALIMDGTVQPVTIIDCDEDCWRRALLSINLELNPAAQSPWENWYKPDVQGDLNLFVYCSPGAERWQPCSSRN